MNESLYIEAEKIFILEKIMEEENERTIQKTRNA
jgi:hypothetical protein